MFQIQQVELWEEERLVSQADILEFYPIFLAIWDLG
jgi:hypothetical protein